jgi:ATP-dependent exoDNAse (exonuclease V) alpha subunit
MGILSFLKHQKTNAEQSQDYETNKSSNLELDLGGEFGRTLDYLENSKKNLFITGKAGTGKSTLLQCYKEKKKNDLVSLAPTGIAAINIGGQTIHSFFKFPPKALSKDDIHLVGDRKIYQNLQTIIIDEISMVRADLLDAVDLFLKINRFDKRPFGGVQMIFFGDIFQLQPVVRTIEEQHYFASYYDSPYFFDAKVMDNFEYEYIELTKVFRQKDEEFVSILDAVRLGDIRDCQLDKINSQYRPNYQASRIDNSITLTSTNKLANQINLFRLSQIIEKEYSFEGKIEGEFPTSSLPTERVLRLKKGAQIMLVKNDPGKRWVNGTIAKIIDIDSTFIEILINEKSEEYKYSVTPARWEIIKYRYDYPNHKLISEVVGVFEQYPLKLAWAITIHKSQGLTFNNVVIDIGNGAFAHGQTYVALSRCTSLEGITLKKKFAYSDIIIDSPVMKYYTSPKH